VRDAPSGKKKNKEGTPEIAPFTAAHMAASLFASVSHVSYFYIITIINSASQ
jgi:hypothetical protein